MDLKSGAKSPLFFCHFEMNLMLPEYCFLLARAYYQIFIRILILPEMIIFSELR